MGRRKEPREHGTVKGWRQHHYDKTVPCLACCRAQTVNWTGSNRRGKCAKGLGWPLEDADGQ